ncbi:MULTISPECIES: exonuclease subunit SbcD [unclassified Shewanella]|uniref:exonuclease subunit SbcD n=1 Tax=unclassified Shewanella TaxID=196818 RepID=UPI000C859FC2|nr:MULTISPECIES: exonuclease subunit SbcD [unclassified Shewanella]MDO6678189.1 exonuclease subunit SbcD [Shewanella sp. 4_MG-2023]MDO6775928.1 exonuclease subunit SbcD [Shewanella sp. 3_MG-2023]PMG30289.1 exonuclease subunit SbcD [Shewanella sp. 10N.286.52.C2]PMG40046.1 exonuclease subunit SbcD [Shewanella sp. 10N.286.52.B9]PMH84673.1 exonuclease subunit SbcD [Shewanella sp. 10N.286.48.B5]
MRIIHTSDWHLGQNFYGKSRAVEHKAFLQWLLAQISQHQVDALIVAGDIFDTGTPPSYARSLYNQFIVDIQATNCKLIVLGGNHDSVATLGESKQLLACLNATVIPGALDNAAEHVLLVADSHDHPCAIVCALPYLRPRDIVLSESGESSEDKQRKLANEIADLYQRCFAHAQAINNQQTTPLPIIATGHLTTVGASTSESVRDIYIGSLDAFNANLFPAADYIALGHIHRPQKIAKTEHIRYSGSPISLSFDELNSQKSVYLVEFDKAKLAEVSALEVPKFQAMASVKGSLAEIASQLETLVEQGSDQVTWLSIEVAEQDFLTDLQSRIAELTDALPVEVLQLKRARSQRQQQIQQMDNETLTELSVTEVFERRLAQEDFSEPEQQQRLERVKQQFDIILDEMNEQLNGTAQHVEEAK